MAIDERKDYTSADVLTVDDALSLAVMGYNVRAVDMQPGAFINYNFAGWRINFEGGSSSGWSKREHDETVAWHVIDDPEPVKPAAPVTPAAPAVADVLVMGEGGKWGRAAPTPAPAPPSVGKWGNGQPPKKDSWGRPLT